MIYFQDEILRHLHHYLENVIKSGKLKRNESVRFS